MIIKTKNDGLGFKGIAQLELYWIPIKNPNISGKLIHWIVNGYSLKSV